jgi:hypothetical protein
MDKDVSTLQLIETNADCFPFISLLLQKENK